MSLSRSHHWYPILERLDRLRMVMAGWFPRPVSTPSTRLRFTDFERCELRNPVSESFASLGVGVWYGINWFGSSDSFTPPAAVAAPATPEAPPESGREAGWALSAWSDAALLGTSDRSPTAEQSESDELAGDELNTGADSTLTPAQVGSGVGSILVGDVSLSAPPPDTGSTGTAEPLPVMTDTNLDWPSVVSSAPELSPPGGLPFNLSPIGVMGVYTPSAVEGERSDLLLAEIAYPEGASLVGSVDWGDGEVSPARVIPVSSASGRMTAKVYASHVFATVGTHPGTLTLWGAAVTPTSVAVSARVTAAALAITPAVVRVTEGEPFTGTLAHLRNPNPFERNDWAGVSVSQVAHGPRTFNAVEHAVGVTTSAVVSADGQVSVPGGLVFDTVGPTTVTLTINDPEDGLRSVEVPVEVTDAPLTVTGIDGPFFGVVSNVTLATVVDADPSGPSGLLTAIVDWGDGTGERPATLTPLPGRSNVWRVTGSHAYVQNGGHTVRVRVESVDGSIAAGVAYTTSETEPAVASTKPHAAGEGRPLPLPFISVGTDGGSPGRVRSYFAETGELAFERTPFGEGFTGGVRVATADVNRDTWPDLIAAAGPGGGPHVKVLDGKTGEPIAGPLGSFFAYDEGFAGGVFVAGGDVDGDGWADVVTAAGASGGPHVKVFSGKTGSLVSEFFAFAPEFTGGVSVAAADFTGDGKADLAVGAGPGGGPHVQVFDLSTRLTPVVISSFYAFDPSFTGGVNVNTDWKAGDTTGDGRADLAVGRGPGAGSLVRVFDGVNWKRTAEFSPFGSEMTAGVRVATAFVNDDRWADVVVATGAGPRAEVKVFDGRTHTELPAPMSPYQPFGATAGGLFVAASNDPPSGGILVDSHASTFVIPSSGTPPFILYQGGTIRLEATVWLIDNEYIWNYRLTSAADFGVSGVGIFSLYLGYPSFSFDPEDPSSSLNWNFFANNPYMRPAWVQAPNTPMLLNGGTVEFGFATSIVPIGQVDATIECTYHEANGYTETIGPVGAPVTPPPPPLPIPPPPPRVPPTDPSPPTTPPVPPVPPSPPSPPPSVSPTVTDVFLVPIGNAWVAPNTGGVRVESALDFDLSPGTAIGRDPALVYNSDTVSVRPILPFLVNTDVSRGTPASVEAQLTWEGASQGWVTFSNLSAGATYLLALQKSTVVAATGLYKVTIDTRVTYNSGTPVNQSLTWLLPVVANDASEYGAGWGLDGVDRLVEVNNSVRKGVLWVRGSGDVQFYEEPTSATAPFDYTSPPDDPGKLKKKADGTYEYTATDRTLTRFNSGGRMTAVVDTHSIAVTYTYDGSNRLTRVTTPDGGVTTLNYSSGKLASINEPGSRLYDPTVDGSGDLTTIVDVDGSSRTFGYGQGGHRLSSETWASQSTTFAYATSTHGRLTQVTRGQTTVDTLIPRQVVGLSTTSKSFPTDDYAKLTNPNGEITTYQLDQAGRLRREDVASGYEKWDRDSAGNVIVYTDRNGQETVRWYDAKRNLTLVNHPDGGWETYQYESAFNQLVRAERPNKQVTTYGVDSTYGDRTSVTDARGNTTTYVYDGGGLLTQVNQPSDAGNSLSRITTYAYDSDRRLTAVINPLGLATTTSYDSVGNVSEVWNPVYREAKYEHDARNRVSVQWAGDGGIVVQNRYDAAGNVTWTYDSSQRVVRSEYDARGWKVTDIEGAFDQNAANQMTDLRTTTYAYDSAGNQTEVIDPRTNRTTFAYDSLDRVTTTTDAVLAVTTTQYDQNGNATAVTNARGFTTTYQYDAMNRQVVATNPLNQRTTTAYDLNGNVTLVTGARVADETRYVYDALNRVAKWAGPTGGTSHKFYDAVGNITTTSDQRGDLTGYQYDAANRLTLSDVGGDITTYAYDNAGQLSKTYYGKVYRDLPPGSAPASAETQYKYDLAGRVTEVGQSPVYSDVFSFTSATTTLYDTAGRVTEVTDPTGHRTRTTYDALSRATSVTEAYGTPLARVTTNQYDLNDNLTKVTTPLTATTSATTTFLFDAADRQTASIDAIGRLATTLYDAVGNVTKAYDHRGNHTDSTYDPLNRVTVVNDKIGRVTTFTYDDELGRQSVTDPLNNTSWTHLDLLGRVTLSEGPLNRIVATEYNAVGDVTYTWEAQTSRSTTYRYDSARRLTSQTDSLNNTTTYQYDAVGNRTRVIDPKGHATEYYYDQNGKVIEQRSQGATEGQYFEHDAAGRLTKTGWPNAPIGAVSYFQYDDLGRQTLRGANLTESVQTEYDLGGRVTKTNDSDGVLMKYRYDAAGRRTEEENGLGHVTTFQFDANDNLTRVKDALNNVTTYEYDRWDRKTKAWDPFGHAAVYEYDFYDHATKATDRLTRVTENRYDDAGRLTQTTWKNPGGAVVGVSSYTYDSAGNMLTAANAAGTHTFQYDTNNRVTRQEGLFGVAFTFAYDANGRVTKREDNLGGWESSDYTPQGQLSERHYSESSGKSTGFSLGYDGQQRRVLLKRYTNPLVFGLGTAGQLNNTTSRETGYIYNDMGRLSAIRDYPRGTLAVPATVPYMTMSYAYTNAGRISGEGYQQNYAPSTTTYDYDLSGQLKTAGTYSFGYDAIGTRNTNGNTPASGGQLQTDGTWTFTYDAEGQLTQKAKANGESWAYEYDHAGRMTRASQQMAGGGSGAVVSYLYDSVGNLVQRQAQASPTATLDTERYVYDGQNAVMDLKETNEVRNRRLFTDNPDDVVTQVKFETDNRDVVTWYLTDKIGSVVAADRLIGNGGGGFTSFGGSRAYDPYGQILSETPLIFDRYGYTGRELDPITKLQYNRARWYDASTGRWTSRDPIEFGGGDSNLYRYVHNDPINSNDPTGLAAEGNWWWRGDGADGARWLLRTMGPVGNLLEWAASDHDRSTAIFGDLHTGWFAQTQNGAAGAADTISGGLTGYLRQGLGYDDVVDYNSTAYRVGTYVGTAVNIGLMFANPAGMSSWARMGLQAINLMSTAGGLITAGKAAANGDWSAAAVAGLGAAASRLRGAGGPCGKGFGGIIERGLWAYSATQSVKGIGDWGEVGERGLRRSHPRRHSGRRRSRADAPTVLHRRDEVADAGRVEGDRGVQGRGRAAQPGRVGRGWGGGGEGGGGGVRATRSGGWVARRRAGDSHHSGAPVLVRRQRVGAVRRVEAGGCAHR